MTHGYGGVPVLRGLSLTVPGGVYGVLGNNGAGKSTLLKLAAGFTLPEKGRVRIHGLDTRTQHQAAKALSALLPEALRLDDLLTPAEFLTFVAEVRAVPGGREEGLRLLDRLGAGGQRDLLFRELSFGTRRKVGVAAVFLGGARLIVLDEPGTGLDVTGLSAVETLIRQRVAEGATVVLSSHDMAFVARMCERVMVLFGDGRVCEATPKELMAETGTADLHHAFRALVDPGGGMPEPAAAQRRVGR